MKEYQMSQASDWRIWEDRDLTGGKMGKVRKGDDLGSSETLNLINLPREHAGGCT